MPMRLAGRPVLPHTSCCSRVYSDRVTGLRPSRPVVWAHRFRGRRCAAMADPSASTPAAPAGGEDTLYVYVAGGEPAVEALERAVSTAGPQVAGFNGPPILYRFRAWGSGSAGADLPNVPSFSPDAYFAALQTRAIGRTLLGGRAMPSTQTLIASQFALLPPGAVCVADTQAAGRGRGRNAWATPAGGLAFSLGFRLTDGATLPCIQYVAALAVVEAVQKLATPLRLPLKIKWPNDIYAEMPGSPPAKIGGVLCTSTYSDKGFNVTVGVGLNVANPRPTTCLNAVVAAAYAASMDSESGESPVVESLVVESLVVESLMEGPLSREALLSAVLSSFEELLGVFVLHGFGPLIPAYLRHWMHTGQRLVVKAEDTPGGVAAAIDGVEVTVTGITAAGFLSAAESVTGTAVELHPDGTSLDWFQGLVRRKIA